MVLYGHRYSPDTFEINLPTYLKQLQHKRFVLFLCLETMLVTENQPFRASSEPVIQIQKESLRLPLAPMFKMLAFIILLPAT